jgi:hypothetical protein
MDKLRIGRFPLPLNPNASKENENPMSRVTTLFEESPKYHLSEETISSLKSPNLDVWQFDSNELVMLLLSIFETLGINKEFNISHKKVVHFLYTVRDHYNANVRNSF